MCHTDYPDYDPAFCYAGDLAGKWGPLVPQGTGMAVLADFEDATLDMYPFDSLVGRSVAIRDKDGHMHACATIRDDDEEIELQGNFTHSTLLKGYVVLRESAVKPETGTEVLVDLQYIDPSDNPGDEFPPSQAHTWYITPYQVTDWSTCATDCPDQAEDDVTAPARSCMFNPYEESLNNCDDEDPWKCATGDMSGKMGMLHIPCAGMNKMFKVRQQQNTVVLLVAAAPPPPPHPASPAHQTDPTLPLGGAASVQNMTLLVFEHGTSAPMACTELTRMSLTSKYDDSKWDKIANPKDKKKGLTAAGGWAIAIAVFIITAGCVVAFFIGKSKGRHERFTNEEESATRAAMSNANQMSDMSAIELK